MSTCDYFSSMLEIVSYLYGDFTPPSGLTETQICDLLNDHEYEIADKFSFFTCDLGQNTYDLGSEKPIKLEKISLEKARVESKDVFEKIHSHRGYEYDYFTVSVSCQETLHDLEEYCGKWGYRLELVKIPGKESILVRGRYYLIDYPPIGGYKPKKIIDKDIFLKQQAEAVLQHLMR